MLSIGLPRLRWLLASQALSKLRNQQCWLLLQDKRDQYQEHRDNNDVLDMFENVSIIIGKPEIWR